MSGDGTASGDGTESDTGETGELDCAASEITELGDVHRYGGSPSSCLFAHHVIVEDEPDQLRVLTIADGHIETISDTLLRTLPYSFRFVPGRDVLFLLEYGADEQSRLVRWEDGERVVFADRANELVFDPAGELVFYGDSFNEGRVWVQPVDGGPSVSLAESARIEGVHELDDGTVGAILSLAVGDGHDLAWAEPDGSIETFAVGARLAGFHAPSGRAFVQSQESPASYRVVDVRGLTEAVELPLEEPAHPGDITARGEFSPDGTRVKVQWEVFDYDYGYTDAAMHLVTLNADVEVELHACAGGWLSTVHDAGILCLTPGDALTGTVVFHPYVGGVVALESYDTAWFVLPGERLLTERPVEGGAVVDGEVIRTLFVVDASSEAPTVEHVAEGFLWDVSPAPPGTEQRWAFYSERPWKGYQQQQVPSGWHALDVAEGTTAAVPGIPAKRIAEERIGPGAVAFQGPSNGLLAVGPHAP